MRFSRHDTILLSLVFAFVCVWLWTVFAVDLPGLAIIARDGVSGDTGSYSAGALSLIQKGIYSLDGVHPFFEREIGYSVFLAGVYAVFGVHNYLAVLCVQMILLLAALLVFERSLHAWAPGPLSLWTLGILFLLPSVYLLPSLLLRESLALSLLLLFTAFFLDTLRRPSLLFAAIAGVWLGLGILVYAPFLLLPLFLFLWIPFLKIQPRYLLMIALCSYLLLVPWAVRNIAYTGKPCLTGCYREALQWYVRGERAEFIRGLEPYRCLWSEYVSRDWTGRSPYCSFNAAWHKEWPQGFVGVPADQAIAAQGKAKILRYFPYYLWDSVSEVVEFHLPYVGPWGHLYNLLESVAFGLLGIGCLGSLSVLFQRKWLPFVIIIVYSVALFALTDATPRYHMPLIFCYAVLSAIGYHRILIFLRVCRPSA